MGSLPVSFRVFGRSPRSERGLSQMTVPVYRRFSVSPPDPSILSPTPFGPGGPHFRTKTRVRPDQGVTDDDRGRSQPQSSSGFYAQTQVYTFNEERKTASDEVRVPCPGGPDPHLPWSHVVRYLIERVQKDVCPSRVLTSLPTANEETDFSPRLEVRTVGRGRRN